MALFTGIATTWRTLGTAATTHNLMAINNATGSGRVITMRRLTVQLDATVALTAVMPQVKTVRTSATLPAGGQPLTKGAFDVAQTSAANITVLGTNTADGGAATAITTVGTTISNPLWQQFCMRLHTLAGQVLAPDNNLLPALIDTPALPSFLIPAGQGILVQVIAAVGTSNPATNHWFVQAVWEEN